MKVVAFNGSPHPEGNTAQAIAMVTGELEACGIQVETVQVGNRVVRGCIGCDGCYKREGCVFENDVLDRAYDLIRKSDGIIIGSPVYYSGIAGTMKCFLDRLFYCGARHLWSKVGLSVVTLRRSGGVETYDQLNHYFQLAGVIVPPTDYWAVIHGAAAGEVQQDDEGKDILRAAGRSMAWLMQAMEQQRQSTPPPVRPKRTRTNFIR